MPLYDYKCGVCGNQDIVHHGVHKDSPLCCDTPMNKMPSCPAVVKIKGAGGYPSRRKFVNGTAPYTGRGTQAWGSHDPLDKSINYMGTKSAQANIEKDVGR